MTGGVDLRRNVSGEPGVSDPHPRPPRPEAAWHLFGAAPPAPSRPPAVAPGRALTRRLTGLSPARPGGPPPSLR